jgi:hypothetical protein
LLVKGAWRAGYRGLAAAIAVAWDSSLSPVDVRSLTPAQHIRDSQGDVFMLARAKNRPGIRRNLSRRASRVLDAYLVRLGIEIAPGLSATSSPTTSRHRRICRKRMRRLTWQRSAKQTRRGGLGNQNDRGGNRVQSWNNSDFSPE